MAARTELGAGPSSVTRVARRLGRSTLGSLGPGVVVPTYDVDALRPGVVHLGTGAFHRAHQASYFHEIAQRGLSLDWGIIGSGLHTGAMRRPFLAQDGLYSLVEVGDDVDRVRVIGSVRDYIDASSAPQGLVEAMARPSTRLVTMTITAPAYRALHNGGAPTAAFSLLVDALARRRRAGLAPFTVLSCDNLPDNGALARACVVAAAEARDPALASWIAEHVAFPSSMVDRITPPVSRRHVRELRRRHALLDDMPVLTEPFSQWVVEDTFTGERPPLEEVGVQLVPSARPYVDMKTCLLNGSHVALGFLGSRAGHATTAEAMRDPEISGLVRRLMRDEVAPLLDPVPGVDLADYQRTLLSRFSSEAMADPLGRLCARGSVRVRNYVVPSLRRAVLAGAPHRSLTLVVAAWIDHLAHHRGEIDVLADPAAPILLPLALRATRDVRPFLAAVDVVGDLADSTPFVTTLQRALTRLEDSPRVAAS